ncbi:subtilisin-like protein [Myriangium duriaei CBS 260.36]|uniref:Subtilisin-like protein n=1 Tax=Myriangium duriaei CBS 260.36 TaxID=1168546 RepID=A0A9P4IV66_9PEZI|nr:subtilisin-like protein [Myriangium duriaei CBS 260.36]
MQHQSSHLGPTPLSSELDDFCALLRLPLGPSCIPLRFLGIEPNHSVLRLGILQPDLILGSGAGIPLRRVLADSKLPATGKLILAYLIAKSYWQYYQSAWIKTNWSLETIHFLPEDRGGLDLTFNPYAPFLDLHTSDQPATVPQELKDASHYVHRHPQILVLGLLLFQICNDIPYETEISKAFSPIAVNRDCAHFFKRKRQGSWPALDLDSYYVNTYKNTVAECFPAQNTSNFEGTLLDPELNHHDRRALLRDKVVLPLHGLLQGMQVLDQDENICVDAFSSNSTCIDQTGQFDSAAQEWLNKISRSWLTSHIRDKLKSGDRYNPRTPILSRPKIAVLDTGYDPGSGFLTNAHKIRLRGRWKDFWADSASPIDADGHGTSMLSLVVNIASFADIYVARIASTNEDIHNERQKTSDNLAKAIDWAVCEQKVDIVSMSFGWDKEILVNDKPIISNMISKCLAYRDQKVLFFAAASNFGGGTKEMFPAIHKSVFSIRATNTEGFHPHFNPALIRNEAFVLGTLGCNVPTSQRGNTLIPLGRTGTSVATAIAVGLVALIIGYINATQAKKWESLRAYDSMMCLLETLSEEPEAKKRFITPNRFPTHPDAIQDFEARLTTACNS